MIRHLACVALVMCLTPASLYAQGTATVNTVSANVYKAPSTGSPVIGHASRGDMLQISRDLGSWVKVPWPGAPDGIGYLHVSTVTVAHVSAPDAYRSAAAPSARPAAVSSPSMSTVPTGDRAAAQPVAAIRPVYVSPASHVVGIGATMAGPTLGYGATARAWRRNRVGIQLEVSRSTFDSTASPSRVTAFQIEPSVLYSLRNRVSDYVWLRPYIGAGGSLSRQTSTSTIVGLGDSRVENRFGVQAFGGGELTFSSLPQFSLSGDVGYHWTQAPLAGVDLGGVGVSLSAHWYVK